MERMQKTAPCVVLREDVRKMTITLFTMDETEGKDPHAIPEQRLFEEIINKAVSDARSVPIELVESNQRALNKTQGAPSESKSKTRQRKVYSHGRTEETVLARDAIEFLMRPDRSDIYLGLINVDPELFRTALIKINREEAATEAERKARRIFRANLAFYEKRKAYEW